ncbi:hypothetical protein BIW11_09414 [Tropilaelaps mercedesae]|uniref:Uncharacterized protein n=1 Tax=Tropilaelaps mercedesae TaxID=418985 RepID=A0A1V9XK97_9ACAR|nr:hypothetical protein BIW11_09414 [Tropilaelaps mercedesae]
MQSIAAAVFFYFSTQLVLPYQLVILLAFAIMGTGCFVFVACKIAIKEEEDRTSYEQSAQQVT